jgi:CHAT domain-containing protein/Tfp pilus assembly protein PilF
MATHTVIVWLLVALAALVSVPARANPATLDLRLDAAVTLYREDGAAKALPVFERLGSELGESARPHDQAAVLHYIGECHWRLGNFREARDHLDRALALERRTGDRDGEGKTLNVLGLLAWDQGEYDEAIDRFARARAVARNLGDKKLEGASLNNLSLVYDELGDYDVSLKQYQQVLELYREVDFPRGVGDTLGNIGGVHLLLGQFRDALGYYQQALAISERLNSRSSMSQDNGNIALCLLGLGETDDALKHFDRAIHLAKLAGMRQDEAYWMRQMGNGLIRKGLYDQGLAAHRTAIAVYEEIEANPELAEALHDTGRLHLLLGDPDSAERFFAQSLDLSRNAGLSRGITRNLIALGELQYRRKAFHPATKLYKQAQQRSAESGERQLEAQSLLHLAEVDREQQRLVPAFTEIGAALAIARDIGARPLEAEALLALGDLQRRRGQLDEALRSLESANAAILPTRDPDLLWRIEYGRARTQEARGEPRAAIESLLAAARIIESVRMRLQEPRFRAGFVDDKYDVYVDLVRLQLQLGLTHDAFSTAERLRARSFAEQLAGRTSLPLSDGDRRREAQLIDRIRQLQRALTDEGSDEMPARSDRATSRFSQELQRTEEEYQAFLDDRVGPNPAPAPLDTTPDLPDVQRQLRDDEALIEYVVGPRNLMAFVVTRDSMTARSTPLRLADLNARIALLRDLAQRPGDDRWLKSASQLSADLFGQLVPLPALRGVRRLYIVPHGVLNYLPFALLPVDPARPDALLVDKYAMAYLPSAAVLLRQATAPAAPRSLLTMAPARSRLRYAPEEAHSIDALFAPDSRLLVGSGATESQFKRLAGGFGMLHLATHGLLNRVNPLLSGLELEADAHNDGLLQVHEVLALRLRADLVTLSACETALGSGYFAEVPAGDDFVGMTRAFLAAGSASVVAALWDVDDRASGVLMKRFYERLKQSVDTESTADSLTRAQRELHASKGLGHPYYWGPFVVVGAMNQSNRRPELSAGR